VSLELAREERWKGVAGRLDVVQAGVGKIGVVIIVVVET
jgi:hypothetical protein